MADSDSEVSDIDIDPALKNTDEYMELMRLKVIAKMRLKEQAGSVEKVEWVHHSYSCDACQVSPIVGIRWKCLDCPYECQVDLCNDCIQSDFQTETHKLDHDFAKIEKPEEPWDEQQE
ncbi:UNVERIFIED_CONTAM: ZZ-type zinc finger-containing protein 3 [Siphonaria sp. JEL0065]|nr:ZZ-type zinc finger-containing protein 3 [Siphonaria sp. JEL0065]